MGQPKQMCVCFWQRFMVATFTCCNWTTLSFTSSTQFLIVRLWLNLLAKSDSPFTCTFVAYTFSKLWNCFNDLFSFYTWLFVTQSVALASICFKYCLLSVCMSKGEKLQVHGVWRATLLQCILTFTASFSFPGFQIFSTFSYCKWKRYIGMGQKTRHSQHDW